MRYAISQEYEGSGGPTAIWRFDRRGDVTVLSISSSSTPTDIEFFWYFFPAKRTRNLTSPSKFGIETLLEHVAVWPDEPCGLFEKSIRSRMMSFLAKEI